MKDEVFNELVQKTITQIFADMEKDGEVGKLVSRLLSGVVVASVSYAVEQTLNTVKEHPEYLSAEPEISKSEEMELNQP